ncbi:MAG TPA: MATE family efflux transporter [Pirellulaceae bacterium]|nr:MATE family efflux transporter [Pirellulaceae bacterium]HMO92352.1 MATE family efflux transporter [Pirellulaceae bacterium]HMP69276.1 MATE family efflux transporter [Pirellulaceae bacterium]
MQAKLIDQHEASWWKRPAGGREVLGIAIPLVISSLSWTVMSFIDRIFLNWVSGAAMAAAFSASLVWFVFLCFPLGVCAYANTFVAQYWGNHQPNKIGGAVWQAIWVASSSVIIVPLLIWIAPWLFSLSGHSAEIQQLETDYFQALSWGSVGILVSQAGAAFYSGRGRTSVVMWVDTLFALLNVVLDYCWIFGEFGFPEMGIVGAGYATSLALCLKGVTYVLLMLQPQHRLKFATGSSYRFDFDLMQRLLKYGAPSGLQMLVDVVGFTVFVMLIGRLGSLEHEATSMAFSISTLAFMPIWGFGLAVGILVGQRLGENQPELAARATHTTLIVALTYMTIISLLYLLIPQVFLFTFFLVESDPEYSVEVQNLAITLLRFVAAYNLFDAMLIVFSSAIKGAGDTRFVFLVSLVMAVFLALGSWLAIERLSFNVFGSWVLITGWVWATATIFGLRFLGGKWRSMRVIELVEAA